MPIPTSQINTDWIPLPKTTTLGELRQRVPRDRRRIQWVVTAISGQDYAVYRVSDLIGFLRETMQVEFVTSALLNQTLEQLGNFLQTCTRAAIDVNANWFSVRENWNERTDPPLVVLQNGTPIGILKSTVRGGGSDVDLLENEAKSANGGGSKGPPAPPPPTSAEPPPTEGAPPPITVEGPPKGAESMTGKLGAKDVKPPAPSRHINVSFEPPEQKDSPLQVGETYTLVFSVDLERIAQAIADAVLDETRIFPPNVDQVDLFVQLISDDFDILTDPQKLIVPREGKSKNRARFDISPKHNGESELTAVILKDGNAVQAITLKLNVGVAGAGAIVKTTTLGRTVEAAGAVQPRALSLWIDYKGEGFKVSFLGPDESTSFLIPLQLQELELAISKARAALQQIVDFQDKGVAVYQTDVDISADVKNKTLPQLARAGYILFQTIFMHHGSGKPAQDFAQRLRDMVKGESLHIQIISKQMMLPWGILYLADRFDPNNIQPELFLGLKHVIEHAPMEPSMDFPTGITSTPQLTVSLNLNKEIDKQMNFPLIANQQKYWDAKKQKGGISLITRTNSTDLLDALANTNTPDQIAYFYCHAVSKGLSEGGANASILQFGANQSVTLEDFMISAPLDIRLAGSPLVFINACESAELSPLFYNGFMPYFVDKGARGMIGTECPVPAFFAMDWAAKFFDQFLAGKPLGQLFLDLRRDYFFNHNNVLGLLYAVYCDADTQVTPALQ